MKVSKNLIDDMTKYEKMVQDMIWDDNIPDEKVKDLLDLSKHLVNVHYLYLTSLNKIEVTE